MAIKNKKGRSVLVDADMVFGQGRYAPSHPINPRLARSRDSLGNLAVAGLVIAGIGTAVYQALAVWFNGLGIRSSLTSFYQGLDAPYTYIFEFYMYSIGFPIATVVVTCKWLFNLFMSPYIAYPLAIIGTFYFALFVVFVVGFGLTLLSFVIKARYLLLAYLSPLIAGMLWYAGTSILSLFA